MFPLEGEKMKKKKVDRSFSASVTCKALGLPYLEIKNT